MFFRAIFRYFFKYHEKINFINVSETYHCCFCLKKVIYYSFNQAGRLQIIYEIL